MQYGMHNVLKCAKLMWICTMYYSMNNAVKYAQCCEWNAMHCISKAERGKYALTVETCLVGLHNVLLQCILCISKKYALTVETCSVGMHNSIPGKPRISEGLGSLPSKVNPSQSQPFQMWDQKAKFSRNSALPKAVWWAADAQFCKFTAVEECIGGVGGNLIC